MEHRPFLSVDQHKKENIPNNKLSKLDRFSHHEVKARCICIITTQTKTSVLWNWRYSESPKGFWVGVWRWEVRKVPILDLSFCICSVSLPVVYSRIKIFTYTLFWKAIWKLLEDRKRTDEKKEEKQSLLSNDFTNCCLLSLWMIYYLLSVLIKCSWIDLY